MIGHIGALMPFLVTPNFCEENVGIAFGAFADPSLPWPTLSVWETTRHPWVTFDHQPDRFTLQPKIDATELATTHLPIAAKSPLDSGGRQIRSEAAERRE